jgi:hypothetical protein
MYCDSLDNVKIQTLEPELFKAWINLLALAKIHGGAIPTVSVVAFRLRIDVSKAKYYLDALSSPEVRLLDVQPDGSWKPHDWNNWQYEWDSAAERMRRYRKKKKSAAQKPPVTSPLRNPERNSDGIEQSRAEQKQSRERETKTDAALAAPPAPQPSKRATRLSVGTLSAQWAEWPRGHMNWDRSRSESEFDRFADYYAATGKTYKDWFAAWRNWCRKASTFDNDRPAARTDSNNHPKWGEGDAFDNMLAKIGVN